MCRCGKRLFEHVNDGTCWWCGYGDVVVRPCDRRPARLRRLPRDLGAIQREGRRPDPHLDNVVRLDRLRDNWKIPPTPDTGEKFVGEFARMEQAA